MFLYDFKCIYNDISDTFYWRTAALSLTISKIGTFLQKTLWNIIDCIETLHCVDLFVKKSYSQINISRTILGMFCVCQQHCYCLTDFMANNIEYFNVINNSLHLQNSIIDFPIVGNVHLFVLCCVVAVYIDENASNVSKLYIRMVTPQYGSV